MQNFTLGKKGMSMLLFAFILLTTSFSSFGQENCPTLSDGDNSQEFCYLSTVADLEANANGDEVRWYRTSTSETSSNPIPQNELLQTGTYYAGNVSGSCQNRLAVNVIVDDAGAPEPVFGNIFSPCVYGVEPASDTEDADYLPTIADLIANITGNEVEIYSEQFSGNAIAGDTPLVRGANYFAGQRSADDCPSSRVAIRYDPIYAPAPAAETLQTFCEGATVADLEAQATSDNSRGFRWYSTLDSQPALASSTPLIQGETYYVSQIVNRIGRDEPPCESVDRTAVTVTIEPTALNESIQRFCESIGEGNDFRTPEVRDLSPQGAIWFATADATQPLDPQTELVEGEDYFNRENGSECAQDRVVVDIFPTPNAGRTTETSFCQNEEATNLVDRINESQLGPADQTGSFSPALSTGTNIFDPADYEPGSYNFTYIVEGNDDCPTDTSQITVTVEAAPNAGAPVNEVVCSSQLDNFAALAAEFSSLLEGRDTGGTFNPTLETLFAQYNVNPIRTFTTVYTVGAEGECQDSAELSVTVLASPNAGQNGSVDLSRDDAPFNLFTELEGSPDPDGTWSPGNEDGSFDPATGEAGTYTYTVTIGECTDTATVSVTFEDECPVVEITTQSFCQSIGDGNNFRRPRIADLMPSGVTWYTTADSDEPITDNRLLVDGTTYYAGNSQGTCEDRTPVLVNIDQAPNAGRTTALTVCSNDAPFDLVSRINESILGAPDAGGTFSPALASGTTIFDPAVDTAGTYTYTVQSTNDACPNDSSIITVSITNVNAGENATVEVSREDAPFNLFTELNGNPMTGGTWSPGNANGSFDPATGETGTYTYTVTNGTCTDTAEVNVVILEEECPVVEITTQSFCQSIGEGNNFRRPRIADLMPAGVTWYATAESDEPITDNRLLVDGTTYYAGNSQGTCEDRTPVLVNIDQAPNAGRTTALTVCSSDAPFDLVSRINESVLGAPDAGGTFSPALASGTTIFDPAVDTAGQYTYRVQSENEACPDDTSSITIRITNVNAGENATVEVSREDASFNLFTELNGNPMTGGTWSPGNADGSFDPATGQAGAYTYTVTNGNCIDTATVTVTFTDEQECPVVTDTTQSFCESIETGNDSRRPRVSDLMPANATWYATATSTEPLASTTVLVSGEDYFAGNENATCPERGRVVVTLDESPNAGRTTAITVCDDDAPFDLLSRINESILGAPDAGGTFTPALASGTTLFDPAVDVARAYTYRVESTNEVCPADTAQITVNINPREEANAGENFALEYCVDEEDVNLFDELEEGVTMGGTFEGYPNGTFSPSTLGEGTYTVTYNIGAGVPCITGTDSATITITVSGAPDAPVADAQQSFCIVDGPTVGDITITGENIEWYSDADLTTAIPETTELVNDATYYARSSVGDGACDTSEAVAVTVTLNTSVSPTIQPEGNEFCRNDNPTVQDLIGNLNGEGIRVYTSSTGGTPLETSTALQNGVTYYATATDATTGCESDERRAVNVEVGFCGIPEAFSPNGDNINDRFVIPDIAEDYPNYTIEIFNRWGNVVFKGNANTPDWDGVSNQSTTLGDNVLPAGVYFYILNYNDGQTTPVQGKLYLSR